MDNLDLLGSHGGRMALAFASGCVATFAFMTTIGGFIWKLIGNTRKDRITELEHALNAERASCAQQIEALSNRIKQLETIFTMHTGIAMAAAVHVEVKPDTAG